MWEQAQAIIPTIECHREIPFYRLGNPSQHHRDTLTVAHKRPVLEASHATASAVADLVHASRKENSLATTGLRVVDVVGQGG